MSCLNVNFASPIVVGLPRMTGTADSNYAMHRTGHGGTYLAHCCMVRRSLFSHSGSPFVIKIMICFWFICNFRDDLVQRKNVHCCA
jgi:hypothetical protein